MTAYLQPGDKIHLQVPDSEMHEHAHTAARAIIEDYVNLGVKVYLVTFVDPSQSVKVVSVIRSAEHCSHLDQD
jgi:hypothetical protein